MQVFHGSDIEIKEIDLSKGRANRDFGKGFYVTKYRNQAELWATRIGRLHKRIGVVTEFKFYENAFTNWDLNTCRFSAYTEEWLDFVVLNRNLEALTPAHDYDIVEGPVADDDVTNRIIDYLAGEVSKADFLQELSFHKPTHQICFCTMRSLQMIVPVGCTKLVISLKEFVRPILEKLILEQKYSTQQASDLIYQSEIVAKLSNDSSLLNTISWEQVYADIVSNSTHGNRRF